MTRHLLLPVLLLFFMSATAQHAKVIPDANLVAPEKTSFVKSEALTAECSGLRKFQDVDTQWMRTLSSRSIEHGAPNKTALGLKKAEKTRLKFENVSRDQNPETANPNAETPTVGTGDKIIFI